MERKTLLIGTGPMAIDYYKVLKSLNKSVTVIGRGEESADNFAEKCGQKPIIGGLENFISQHPNNYYSDAIIVTGTENILDAIKLLIDYKVPSILVEKPAAVSIQQLLENKDLLKNSSSSIFVAYNRRFYTSVKEAKKLIHADGGLSSIHFEFTEWGHVIAPLQKAPGVKENWFFANSTHVVDLAFHLAGKPINWSTYSQGNNGWHTPTNFCGAGITDQNILFSYQANWEAPGRWSVELLTKKHRIYLKPMEKLFIQKIGSVVIEEHLFDTSLDEQYKPGLYAQCDAFFNSPEKLLGIAEHIDKTEKIYQLMIDNSNSQN